MCNVISNTYTFVRFKYIIHPHLKDGTVTVTSQLNVLSRIFSIAIYIWQFWISEVQNRKSFHGRNILLMSMYL